MSLRKRALEAWASEKSKIILEEKGKVREFLVQKCEVDSAVIEDGPEFLEVEGLVFKIDESGIVVRDRLSSNRDSEDWGKVESLADIGAYLESIGIETPEA